MSNNSKDVVARYEQAMAKAKEQLKLVEHTIAQLRKALKLVPKIRKTK
jgi:hypothetical protein